MRITVFYGPKSEFEKKIPKNRKTLTEIASAHDTKKNLHIHILYKEGDRISPEEYISDKEHIDNLVAYSESYSSITESAVQSFISLVNEFDVDTLYLQNPPMQILFQLEQTYPNQVEKESYKYKKISKSIYKTFRAKFPERIIGQQTAGKRLLVTLYPLLSRRDNKPIVIMFYGPSGVGKTETAKFISELLGEELFRKQFSMFHNNEFGDYLFGGSHIQNSLARELLERESNILLFDEFDKPNPIFHSAFYQLFDEGVYEDKNYHVELYNSLIICTSNYQDEEEIRKHLGDPIFYRFNGFIKFNKLSSDAMQRIIEIAVEKRYCDITADEKKKVNKDCVIQFMIKNIHKMGNVRQINQFINELFSMQLINELFNEKMFDLNITRD